MPWCMFNLVLIVWSRRTGTCGLFISSLGLCLLKNTGYGRTLVSDRVRRRGVERSDTERLGAVSVKGWALGFSQGSGGSGCLGAWDTQWLCPLVTPPALCSSGQRMVVSSCCFQSLVKLTSLFLFLRHLGDQISVLIPNVWNTPNGFGFPNWTLSDTAWLFFWSGIFV